MFLNNVKFYVKSTITSTQIAGTTFNISEDFETNTHIETGSDTVSIVLKTTTQIERMIITATGGVATIVKRGLTKLDDGSVNVSYQKQWNDGTIGYITALSSDMPDLDKSSGINVFSSDVKVGNNKKYYIGDNAYITTSNNGTDLKLKDGNNSETTLTELTSGAGTDHKLKVSATDTTAGFLTGKLTAGDGLSKTLINSGADESIDLDIDLTDTTIFTPTPVANKVPLTDSNGNLSGFVPTTQSTFIAGENITAGNALYIHTDGKAYKTDASNSSKINFIGFATNTATTGNNVLVDTSGVSNTQTGLSIGSDYYLSNPLLIIDGNITQNIGGVTDNFGTTGGYQGVGQSFSIAQNKILKQITVNIAKIGNPTDNLVLKIYTGIRNASASSTLLATSNSINGTTITTSFTDVTFTFNNFNLASGTTYFFAIERTGSLNDTNYYSITRSTTNQYSGLWCYLSAISIWYTSSNVDLYFNIEYGEMQNGAISTTPGTNVRRIGRSVSTTAIQLETSANNSLEGTTSTTATTGSVVLGNAVGYITVKINGVDRKIPYYS